MANRKYKRILILFMPLLALFLAGCKKSSTLPQVDVFSPSAESQSVSSQSMTSSAKSTVKVQPKQGNAVIPKVSNRPQPVAVEVDVNSETASQQAKASGPRIWVNPQRLSFTSQDSNSDPPSQIVKIKNSGKGSLQYEISSDNPWLDVQPQTGFSQGESRSHTISVSAAGLGGGTHKGNLTITDPSASNNPQSISVILKITATQQPQIWMSTNQIGFNSTTENQDSLSASLEIKNSGAGTLRYHIECSEPWLSVTPGNGKSTGQANLHLLKADISGMSAGSYAGSLSIICSKAANSPQVVGVTLDLIGEPTPNRIGIIISPETASLGMVIDIPISTGENLAAINTYGLDLMFDPAMFEYVITERGSLTQDWSFVNGHEVISGIVRIGGVYGSGTPVSTQSTGSIAIVRLRVTGNIYNSGSQSQISISGLLDDIAGMILEPGEATFTLTK